MLFSTLLFKTWRPHIVHVSRPRQFCWEVGCTVLVSPFPTAEMSSELQGSAVLSNSPPPDSFHFSNLECSAPTDADSSDNTKDRSHFTQLSLDTLKYFVLLCRNVPNRVRLLLHIILKVSGSKLRHFKDLGCTTLIIIVYWHT